jgi:malate dehydrogenase (oxaloacetate-decarboxylating)(NADP+)
MKNQHEETIMQKKYWEKTRRKGKTLLEAKKWMRERNYFAAMMVNEGDADALITGYSRSYPTVLKPMLELIGMAKGVTRVAATNLMMTERGPMFLSDTSININPTARELAVIARMTSRTVKLFGMEPITAMMSYSNFGSSNHETSQKVAQAVSYLHKYYPDLVVDGELQMDFALNSKLLSENFPFSKLAGKKVNTLVFPNLDAANISYKMLKELNKSESIGPILMGMNKAVHVLQLGAKVEEMVNMAAVAVVDAQQKETMENA